ncbi:MAG TPA: winged helix-turn-helix transcriptional regulator [Solirubrobacterales bacterium]|nr:winged helix-turn-helix transcriptional regulator [Solirubrobacterales bacterium]
MAEAASGLQEEVDGGSLIGELTTADVLRVLGAGATGPILMALGDGPLRTKELTRRVPGYTPRTVYRYSGKLAGLGVIAREEEPGVPSKVVHSLTEPCGRELHDLVHAYADASLTRMNNGELDAHAWSSLALLADLWESGMLEQLNSGPKSPTELARGDHGLSYHQVNRRAGLFAIAGFLHESSSAGNGRSYSLTDKARRAMALVAAVGRWRRRYVVSNGGAGLTPREAGGLLRTILPLVALPEYAEKSFGIDIVPVDDGSSEREEVWARIGPEGQVIVCAAPPAELDVRAQGSVSTLGDAFLNGRCVEGLHVEGDQGLIQDWLERSHSSLWARLAEVSPTPAEAVAGGRDRT